MSSIAVVSYLTDYSQPPPTASNFLPQAAYPQPLTLPEIKSQKLSADAKEFVPRTQVNFHMLKYGFMQLVFTVGKLVLLSTEIFLTFLSFST